MSDEVIDVMAGCDKICPQLHLPVQSGSTAVLERMERGYTRDSYLQLVERLRSAVPEIALTTDIIVGFPGETERDFEETLALMRTVRYDGAFMFKYSRREHTKAFKWEETVSEDEKSRRLQAVIELQERVGSEINRARVGSDVEVLVEGTSRRSKGWLFGRTEQFKSAVFPDCGATPGDLVRIRVADSTAHTLIGASR
jgi:tRNA-2-methylthio-N6-dimethylallyladenosine synthase